MRQASDELIQRHEQRKRATRPKCSVFGCDEPVCNQDMKMSPAGYRCCQEHSGFLADCIKRHDWPALIGLWASSELQKLQKGAA